MGRSDMWQKYEVNSKQIKRITDQINARNKQLKHRYKVFGTRVIHFSRNDSRGNCAQCFDDSKGPLCL